MITETLPGDALERNGVIQERAFRAKRSLTFEERRIILAGRDVATKRMQMAGYSRESIRETINAIEMRGERKWDEVLPPLRIVIEFSYFEHPYEEFPARPQYLIRASNHAALPEGSIVEADQVTAIGQKLPKTPTYDQWVKNGSKAVRS